ncbi:MAG: hypothetical protein CMQ15_17315 [Gammaproteobacteria bacterium]|jgi:hypothetical protein|nr:hypothetical protein [Gammaproteobacteria bacterium]HJN94174.1 hypothetical protein [Gammaproteobacteria bacterium]|tara:strand:- start:128771 stop:129784 length:1014 start_codon:yes stop_codon:yes gene_type:complete
MKTNSANFLIGLVKTVAVSVLTLGFCLTAIAQSEWQPEILSDGQPNITGMWNNVGATATPLELSDQFQGRVPSQEEIAEYIARRDQARKGAVWTGFEDSQGVGAYENYWFDWFWSDAQADAPALIVDPPNGRRPAFTEAAMTQKAFNLDHEHDSAATVESGDRCLSRGVFGMMMPTAYNNGKLIVQSPGYVMIHSEMIHNARIIPIDAGSHVDSRIKFWEGDPRGHWEGNTLIIESTNFRFVGNMRAPGSGAGNAVQNEGRKMIETFTIEDEDTLRYTLTVEDPMTYEAPWTVAFPYEADNEYKQYEYACHEGNYAMDNRLSGQRVAEQGLAETGRR